MKTNALFPLTLFAMLTCISLSFSQGTKDPGNIVGQLKNSSMISILFETDKETISRIVPKQFQAATSNIFDLNIGTQVRPDGSTHHQLFLQIPIRVNGKDGIYMPISYVDSSEVTNPLFGKIGLNTMPAGFQLVHYRNKLDYRVTINGAEIASAEYTLTNPRETGKYADKEMYVNLSDPSQTKKFYVTDLEITRALDMTGSFSLNLPPPIGRIPVKMIKQTIFFECNYNMRMKDGK